MPPYYAGIIEGLCDLIQILVDFPWHKQLFLEEMSNHSSWPSQIFIYFALKFSFTLPNVHLLCFLYFDLTPYS